MNKNNLNKVENKKADEMLKFVNPSCKKCYGTGVYGTKIEGKNRIRLLCVCVQRGYKNRQKEKN